MTGIKVDQVRKDKEKGFEYKITGRSGSLRFFIELLDDWDCHSKGDILSWKGELIAKDKVVVNPEDPIIETLKEDLTIEIEKDFKFGVIGQVVTVKLKYKNEVISEDSFEI